MSNETWTDEREKGEVPTAPAGPRYQPVAELGAGALGTVSAVRDGVLGRVVARKQQRRRTAARDARFMREAQVTACLEHPHIVPVYDLGHDEEGGPWYTMRKVEGETLAHALDQAGPSLDARMRLLGIVEDAAQAVAFAHRRGVLHRDLKPDNVMVGSLGETLVLDWGLARIDGSPEESDLTALTSGDAHHTAVGAVMGTPAYMSPEQARGEPVDARTDVWALGAILYELLGGRPPFEGSARDVLERVRTVRAIPPVRQLQRSAPADLAAVADKALRVRPDDRYPDAEAFLADVSAWRNGSEVSAYRYGPWERLTRWSRRHRAIVLVATAAALVLIVAETAAVVLVTRANAEAMTAQREAEDALEVARQERARTLQALASSWEAQGIAAWRAGRWGEGERWALASLALEPRPVARGLVMAMGSQLRPTLLGSADATCDRLAVHTDGTAVCGHREGVSIATPDGSVHHVAGPPVRSIIAGADSIVTGHDEGRIRLLEPDGSLRVEVNHDPACVVRALLIDGGTTWSTCKAASKPFGIRQWSLAGELLQTDMDPVRSYALAQQPNGDLLVPRAWAGGLRVVGSDSLRVLADTKGPVDTAFGVAWTARGPVVGTAAGGLWWVESGETVTGPPEASDAWLAASPDGSWLVMALAGGETVLVEVASGEVRFRWPHENEGWGRAAFAPDGTLVLADADAIRWWKLQEPGARVVGRRQALSMEPIQDALWLKGRSGWTVVDRATGATLDRPEPSPPLSLGTTAVSPDGSTWAWLGIDEQLVRPAGPVPVEGVVQSIAFDGQSALWTHTDQGLWRDDSPVEVPEGLEQLLVAGARVCSIIDEGLWCVGDDGWQALPGIDGVSSAWASLTAGGKYLLEGDTSTRVWDLDARQLHAEVELADFARAISMDGRWLAISTADTVQMTDLATGELRAVAPVRERVDQLAFGPRHLFMSDRGGTVHTWSLDLLDKSREAMRDEWTRRTGLPLPEAD